MDVNVIFNNVVPIDENKNFVVHFKNEEEILSLFLNKKKDYFITNAIIYINDPKTDNKDIDIANVKKLEEEAKKHIKMEENNKFDRSFAKNFMIVVGDDYLIDSFKQTYYFKFKESEIKDFLKTYKYYNIEKEKIEDFNAYNPLTHLTYGIDFALDETQEIKTKWQAPIDRINIKLNLDEKKFYVSSRQIKDNSYVKNIYSWANKFVVIDHFSLVLVTSSTGWIEIYTNLISNGGLQKYGFNILRHAFAAYYLERKDELIFSHEDNFKNLDNNKKWLVYFIVRKHGYLTVNYDARKHLYVGDDLHSNFSNNFLRVCSKPNGRISNRNLSIYSRKTRLVIPYKNLYRYMLISTFPNDAVWFDINSITIDTDWKVFMQFKLTNEKYELLSDQNDPVLATRLKHPTSKKYNDYSNSLKDFNIESIKTSREHSYFLYDNNALIRGTFITEINKKVNLIGSIAFYEKAEKSGKSLLITSRTKLKFNLKENQLTENFNFNLSHTNASGKILLKRMKFIIY